MIKSENFNSELPQDDKDKNADAPCRACGGTGCLRFDAGGGCVDFCTTCGGTGSR